MTSQSKMRQLMTTASLLFSISCALFYGNAYAFSPTPEQIEQFKSLSPAEQKQLANSMGVSLPSQVQAPVQVLANPETVAPRAPEIEKEVIVLEDKAPEVAEDKAAAPLEPYGYDLFAGNPTTFAPVTDIPVPVDYIIGPGDSVIVQLYGKENSTSELLVSREGEIQFPEIGPISVNSLNYGELKERINQLVSEQMIGVKASVTMGSLRSIRVFILGEAFRPGSYTVSSLSTMTNALFASGGIDKIGSLRRIQLKRRGKIINELDLYDLLMRGDTRHDNRLMPGDVLFIPTVKKTVAISGEVRRPAIYEIKDETQIAQMIELAGGYSSDAYPAAARIERVNQQGQRTIVDVNLKTQSGQQLTLRDGDAVQIPSVLGRLERVVKTNGHLHRPGYFNWTPGLRVKDVIPSVSELKQNPDLTLALLKQEVGEERRVIIKSFNLGAAIRGEKFANIQLQPRDEIFVFEAGATDRNQQIQGYVALLQQQNYGVQHPHVIELKGELKSPGQYPLVEGMTLSDALQLAGYLTPNAAREAVILARKDPLTNELTFSQAKLGTTMTQQILHPRDQIIVFPKEGDRTELLEVIESETAAQSRFGIAAPLVTITGAVKHPGTYPLFENISVESFIEIAGGLREEAYQLSGEISRILTKDSQDGRDISHKLIELTSPEGLSTPLQSRDKLVIKRVPEWGESIEVTLRGEVQFPGTYPVKKGETVSELIQRAGGLTERADPKGAIFLRESLKKKEQEMLDRFKKQLEEEAARLVSQKAAAIDDVSQIVQLQDGLVNQITETEATGRLVFNLSGIIDNKKDAVDVVLKDGDSISIPAYIQEVSILGEVNFPTSHLYERGLNAGEYIEKSGGLTRKADTRHAYVIGRDGAVRPMYKWKFLVFGMKRSLQAGDTLVVPTDIDRMHPLTVWQKTSQILFQLATTAAALQTVGAI